MTDWVYSKARITSKDGVVLFDGDTDDADKFWDDNYELCKGSKHEAHTKVAVVWSVKEGRYVRQYR
jgi:hypothetical protein